MKFRVQLITLIHLSQSVLAMDTSIQENSPIAPDQFTWDELENLKDNSSVKRFNNNVILDVHCADTQQLQNAWPNRLQFLSRNTFASRVLKIEEKIDGQDANTIVATYEIKKDASGYGPYTFQLLCKVLHESYDFEFMSDGDSLLTNPPSIYIPDPMEQTPYPKLLKRERMSPSSLRDKLFSSMIHLDNHWNLSPETYELSNNSLSLYQYIKQTTNIFIVFSPTHDLKSEYTAIQQAECGNLSFNYVLEFIHQNSFFQTQPLTVLIPIAQSNNGRNHWTLLVLNRGDTGIWSGNHLDSKGYYSMPYDLTSIKEALKILDIDYMKSDFFKYFGHQGTLNNIDCGRFVFRYSQLTLQGIDPYTVSTAEITKNFDQL